MTNQELFERVQSLTRRRADGAISQFSSAASGQPVLVTGAGGYIGSALVKAIAEARPARLVLLDASEHNLFKIHRSLEASHVPHEGVLGSVTDANLLSGIFKQFRPQLVYHAAALKHVSLLERNPLSAVHNNAIGTYTLAQAALKQGARALVLVSTDKAVNPHSIMGASKRLAELTVAALSETTCLMDAARLGNVYGSTGSAVRIFPKQISQGGPVTVTHPDASRYFMSLDAAVAAILASAAAPCDGRILLPELDTPLRIADLARFLIKTVPRASAREIAIEFIGLRPGEKLHEDLLFDSETRAGRVADALEMIVTPAPTPAELHQRMAHLACRLALRDLPGVIETIQAMVPEYRPSSEVAR